MISLSAFPAGHTRLQARSRTWIDRSATRQPATNAASKGKRRYLNPMFRTSAACLCQADFCFRGPEYLRTRNVCRAHRPRSSDENRLRNDVTGFLVMWARQARVHLKLHASAVNQAPSCSRRCHLHRDLSDPAPAPHGHAVYLVDLQFDQHQRLRHTLYPAITCTLISVPSKPTTVRAGYQLLRQRWIAVGVSMLDRNPFTLGLLRNRCSPSSRRPLLYFGQFSDTVAVSRPLSQAFRRFAVPCPRRERMAPIRFPPVSP